MKKKKILLFGNPVLREVARPVRAFHQNLHDTIDVMKFTLLSDESGAAIAANQLGILKRIVVISYQEEYLEMVNPKILSCSGEKNEGEEGCLSLPGYWGMVPRADEVTVTYQDRDGEHITITRSGAMARCIQHEVDHLDGILYFDRMRAPSVTSEEGGELLIKDLLKQTPRTSNPA